MKRFRRAAAVVLVALALGRLAAAAELAQPSPAAASAWATAVSGIAAGLSLEKLTPQYQELGRVMAEARLEGELSPKGRSALLFLNYLPGGSSRPEDLRKLDPDSQADLLAQAVARASADVSARADELLAKDSRGQALSSQDRRQLELFSSGAWIYLDSARAPQVRAMAARFGAKKALDLAGTAAKLLRGPGNQAPEPAVAAEIEYVFQGVSRLNAVRSSKRQAAGEEHVRARLAPFVARALDQAGDRLEARGIPSWKLPAAILTRHREVFGWLADRALVSEMRKSREWTPFVATLSLAAAERLEASPAAQAVEALRTGGATHDLKLEIPSWHPLAGRFATVAGALAVHGPRAEASLGRGLRLGRILGAPFVLRPGALAMIGLSAFEGHALAHALPGLGAWAYPALSMGLTALFYGSVLAHELGHAAVAALFGIKTRFLTLSFFGGGAAITHETRRFLPDASVAFAGPFVNLLLGAASLLAAILLHPAPAVVLGLKVLFAANLLLAASNLLPMYPLDGGRITKSLLSLILRDDYRGARAAYYLTLALSALGVGAAAWLGFTHHLALAVATLVTAAIGYVGRHATAQPGTRLAGEK